MTKDEIEAKALALVNEPHGKTKWLRHEIDRIPFFGVLCRAIERHEAFAQEVSDAVERVLALSQNHYCDVADEVRAKLVVFVLPKPVDPLVEDFGHDLAVDIRAALAARGLKIVEAGE